MESDVEDTENSQDTENAAEVLDNTAEDAAGVTENAAENTEDAAEDTENSAENTEDAAGNTENAAENMENTEDATNTRRLWTSYGFDFASEPKLLSDYRKDFVSRDNYLRGCKW